MADHREDWRLTPKESLFKPPSHDETTSLPPATIISEDIMRRLAAGREINEESMLKLADALSDAVLSDETNPLSGFADLMMALHADYAYYDADSHLDGFSEGMAYGMTRLAETVLETLDRRSERFLPSSALDHPDVLILSHRNRTVDADRLSSLLGVPEDQVIKALVDLTVERLVSCSIWGRSRHYYLTRRGDDYAKRICGMASECLDLSDGDIEGATDMLMEKSDFPYRDAVNRVVHAIAGRQEAEERAGDTDMRAAIRKGIEEKRRTAREEVIRRLWECWTSRGDDGNGDSGPVIVTVSDDGSESSLRIDHADDLSVQNLVTLLSLQEVMGRHGLSQEDVTPIVKVTVEGTCGLNAYEDSISCDWVMSDGRTAHIGMKVSGPAIPSYAKPLDSEAYIEEESFYMTEERTTMEDTNRDMSATDDVQAQVESMLAECIGTDDFMEDEDYENLDLHSEYGLDMYAFVEIIEALRERFGLDVTPTQLEWDDVDTVSKVVRLVREGKA